jgi:hypothetical protein
LLSDGARDLAFEVVCGFIGFALTLSPLIYVHITQGGI